MAVDYRIHLNFLSVLGEIPKFRGPYIREQLDQQQIGTGWHAIKSGISVLSVF